MLPWPQNGEVYPIGKDGRLGDSMGNLFDFLGE
jgi:hypothetical protein